MTRLRFRYRDAGRFALLLLTSILCSPVDASELHVEAKGVPQSWLSYSQLLGNEFEAWLSDANNEAVVRLHTYLENRFLELSPKEPPSSSILVKVWIDADGTIRRVEYPTLGAPQADGDLRSVLTTQRVAEPPPPDIRQPIVLRLKLAFKS